MNITALAMLRSIRGIKLSKNKMEKKVKAKLLKFSRPMNRYYCPFKSLSQLNLRYVPTPGINMGERILFSEVLEPGPNISVCKRSF